MRDSKAVKIGTRKSALALWQATHVQSLLAQTGMSTELVPISSTGDQQLQQPLYEMGVQGIFTKTLDTALLNGQIDLAVHSLKDVPTRPPDGLVVAAIPQRGNAQDAVILDLGIDADTLADRTLTVATSSLRRAAQWRARYPHHRIVNTRGNIETRIRRVEQDPAIDATIIAVAGPQRLSLQMARLFALPWMVPAPSQGALGVVCRGKDLDLLAQCQLIDDPSSHAACTTERSFLRALQAGCTMPIAAHAQWEKKKLYFTGAIHALDGQQQVTITRYLDSSNYTQEGISLAEALMSAGGRAIMQTFLKHHHRT